MRALSLASAKMKSCNERRSKRFSCLCPKNVQEHGFRYHVQGLHLLNLFLCFLKGVPQQAQQQRTLTFVEESLILPAHPWLRRSKVSPRKTAQLCKTLRLLRFSSQQGPRQLTAAAVCSKPAGAKLSRTAGVQMRAVPTPCCYEGVHEFVSLMTATPCNAHCRPPI